MAQYVLIQLSDAPPTSFTTSFTTVLIQQLRPAALSRGGSYLFLYLFFFFCDSTSPLALIVP
jgi:hypothetical protein